MNSKDRLHTELKSGLTTGTCASAVAKASVYMVVNQQAIEHVSVALPSGDQVILELKNIIVKQDFAQCSTIKDAGDDPDITNGAEIIAIATLTTSKGIKIRAGKGIGIVTKPGLPVEVGKPAINPTPLKMIHQSVQEVLPDGRGVEVELIVPNGIELAQKTFNPKLGIKGGISILGTSGIVKPMSEEALKKSLTINLKQLALMGKNKVIFSPGNYGTTFSKLQFNLSEENTILTSNYIGFMFEQAVKNKFEKIVLIGHIGKLVKLAGGIFQTHSRVADARNEILSSHYFHYSNDAEGFKKIILANTTEEVTSFIQDKSFWTYLAQTVKKKSEEFIFHELKVEVVLFSQKQGLLGETPKAIELIKEINNEQGQQ